MAVGAVELGKMSGMGRKDLGRAVDLFGLCWDVFLEPATDVSQRPSTVLTSTRSAPSPAMFPSEDES